MVEDEDIFLFNYNALSNEVAAYMWASIAAFLSNEESTKIKYLFEKEMTPSQIDEAKRLAKECIAKEYKGC